MVKLFAGRCPFRAMAIAASLFAAGGCGNSSLNASLDLSWQACGNEFECADLYVPRDHMSPTGPTWKIPVIRLRARDPSQRIGSLVINPGGPGISGVQYLRTEAASLATLRERYDLVSFDPRGAGGSVPAIECLSPAEATEVRNQVSAPGSTPDIDLANRLGKTMAQNCQNMFAEWLPFVGTRDVARDMDLLRMRLSETRLTYLGFSYGTYLGAIYAELFPERTARFVLDGAMDPALDYDSLRRDQAVAMDAALRRFATDCSKGPDCPLPPDPEAGVRALESIVQNLDARPFTASDGRLLSGSRALGLIQSATYFPPETWTGLRSVLAAALRQDFTSMLELAYSPALMVNPADTPYLAVMCHDLGTKISTDDLPALAQEWETLAPFNGPSRAWSTLPCRVWPVRSAFHPAPVRASGSGPILVVGTKYDPSTPVRWARSLRNQLAQASYLEWDGDGHLAYGRAGACVDSIVEQFLLEGVVPPKESFCP